MLGPYPRPYSRRHSARSVHRPETTATPLDRAWLGGRPLAALGFAALLLAQLLALPGAAVELDRLCSGVREAVALGIQLPAPPAETDPPENDVCIVDNTFDLQLAVNGCPHADIVLDPGVYTPDDLAGDYLSFPETRRLWAREPGTVILQFGLSLRTHPGSELHGLVIDIADPQHAVPIGQTGSRGSVVYWGTATDIRIHDTELYGHDVVHTGILGAQGDGSDIRRVGIEGFLRFGVRLNQQDRAVRRQAYIGDIVVRGVGDPFWQTTSDYKPGTEEHGIWIGLPTRLERGQVRDVHWTGIITGNCRKIDDDDQCDSPPLYGVQMIDVDVDRIGTADGLGVGGPGAAIGFERVSTDISVRRFCIGPQTEEGVHAEWNHGFASDSPRDLSILSGVISSHRAGVYLGSGTEDSVLQGLHFRKSLLAPDEHWAAVGMNCSVWPETCTTIAMWDLSYAPDVCCHEARGKYNVAECCAGPCNIGQCEF